MREAGGVRDNAIRAFVAVDTSKEVKAELGRLVQELISLTRLKVKWVKPEQMHLTLVFLGEVSADFIEKAKIELGAVAERFSPIRCQLAGLGAFPEPARARVLWSGIKTGETEIKELQKEVSRALARIGYVPEKRAFTPHLTLGRIRESGDVRFIEGLDFVSSLWQVEEVILYKSELNPTGPVYTPLARFPLKG